VEEQHAVIRFVVTEGNEIRARIFKVYENNCLNRLNIYKWMEQFNSGRESVGDEQQTG